jgi:hypothetical protein
MGTKWAATLKVEFEMEDGQSKNLPGIILRREASQLQLNIERGIGVARTGVKPGSARVEIASQGPSKN